MQPTCAADGWYWPAAHSLQLESPDGLYLPAGQSLQCEALVDTPDPSELELELVVKWPAVQVAQVDCPSKGWYAPAEQLMQLVRPPVGRLWQGYMAHPPLYMPNGQALQCVAPVDTPDPSESELELVVK
jgi:hypothetical protein